jgi:hypothetical protein
MLRKASVDALQLLDAFLRFVSLAFKDNDSPREFLEHLLLALRELFLPAAELLEFAFCFSRVSWHA